MIVDVIAIGVGHGAIVGVVLYFLMHFTVPFLLVGSSETTIADLARERLLARVRAYVCGQMVGAREGSRANVTLERFVARMYSQVSR